MLTRDEVLLGFHLLLGREPEGERAIEFHRNHPNIAEFGRVLRESEEFRGRVARDRVANGECHHWIRCELPSGLSLWIDLHDDGVSAGILRGGWESAETNFILSVIRPGDSVIDIGANLGWYTVALANAVGPEGHVFAFEPRSEIFKQLARSVHDNGYTDRCTLYRTALGLDQGERDLAWSPDEMNPGHSFLLSDGAPPAPKLSTERVRVAALDSIGIERHIRLIKLDVEGAEPAVLRSGWNLIARDRPIIVSEVFPKWLRRIGKVDAYSFLHLLDDLDYRAHYLTDDGIGGEVSWPVTDLESDYVYYSVVFLSAADRLALLDGRRDARAQELMSRVLAAERSVANANEKARSAEERVVVMAADIQRLTDKLTAAEGRVVEFDRIRDDAQAAEDRLVVASQEIERLTRELSLAERRVRAAEFRNLEIAGRSLRNAEVAPMGALQAIQTEAVRAELASAQAYINALHRSSSWRVTAPLRAMRRAFAR